MKQALIGYVRRGAQYPTTHWYEVGLHHLGLSSEEGKASVGHHLHIVEGRLAFYAGVGLTLTKRGRGRRLARVDWFRFP